MVAPPSAPAVGPFARTGIACALGARTGRTWAPGVTTETQRTTEGTEGLGGRTCAWGACACGACACRACICGACARAEFAGSACAFDGSIAMDPTLPLRPLCDLCISVVSSSEH